VAARAIACIAACALAVGCDQGHQDDQAVQGPPVKLVASNITGSNLPTAGRIELAFDRLLAPLSITRQTFVLTDKRGTFFAPAVEYDPVARVVTITPDKQLQDQQFYQLLIAAPQSPTDMNGLRAIDGATLDPSVNPKIVFQAAANAPMQPVPPTVDFCKDILPLFSNCNGAGCHAGGVQSAAGLILSTPQTIAATAVGRVSQEANTGPRAVAQPPGLIFGIDMPILDPGAGAPAAGDPADSWMLYKLLMAAPTAQATITQPPYCDGGMPAPPTMGPMHSIAWQPLSDDERARLANLVPGREMPFPTNVSAPLNQNTRALTVDELELVSRWIGQPRAGGTPLVPATCGACVP